MPPAARGAKRCDSCGHTLDCHSPWRLMSNALIHLFYAARCEPPLPDWNKEWNNAHAEAVGSAGTATAVRCNDAAGAAPVDGAATAGACEAAAVPAVAADGAALPHYVRGGLGGVTYAQALAWLPTFRPYRSASALPWRAFIDQCYLVTHVVSQHD